MTPRPPSASAATSARTHPFTLMRSIGEEMDRFFRDFAPMRWPPQLQSHPDQGFWAPAIEVLELVGRVIVRAELAGLSAKDLTVEVRPDALTISGERKQTSEESAGNYYRSERTYGRFQRTIALPESVKVESAKATFDKGVLEVTFEAAAAPASRPLPIEEKTPNAG
jgi:HSP20 family protein